MSRWRIRVGFWLAENLVFAAVIIPPVLIWRWPALFGMFSGLVATKAADFVRITRNHFLPRRKPGV